MISKRSKRELLELVNDAKEHRGINLPYSTLLRLANELEREVAPKRYVRIAKQRKASGDAAYDAETRGIYRRVAARANGRCECGCGRPAQEMDHFFGRTRVPQSVESCWMLFGSCHYAKTQSKPDRKYWIERFIIHCDNSGYREMVRTALAELQKVQAKEALSKGASRVVFHNPTLGIGYAAIPDGSTVSEPGTPGTSPEKREG